MVKSVTIDNLDIKVHERYARDQINLDPKYVKESSAIATIPEISGTSSIYPSLIEQLFELQVKNIPWAHFSPPASYHLQAKRFFGHQILPTIYFDLFHEKEDENEEENEEENEKKKRHKNAEEHPLIKKLSELKAKALKNPSAFEMEKGTLMSLLESIAILDRLLRLINARKKQYQKG